MRDSSLERRRRSPQDRPGASGARHARNARNASDDWEDDSPPTTGASKLTLSSMPRVGATGGLIRSPQEAWETQASLYVDEDADRDDDSYGGRPADDDYDAYESYAERDEYDQYGGNDNDYDYDYDYDYDDDRAVGPGDTNARLRASSAA